MTRISFTDSNTGNLSWFDDDATQAAIGEGVNWDGNNWRGACSGLQTSRATLYLTAGGRWIENVDATREYNGADSYAFLTDEQAQAWLIRAADARRHTEQAEKALEEWFPDTPEESSPKGGRPKIGPTINVAYPRDLLQRIDAAASKAGVDRANWLRTAAEKALA